MELVTGLAGTLFGGGTAAAGGTAVATAGVGSSFLSGAQLIGSAFTALATIGQGAAASAEAEGASKYAKFEATDKRIEGEQQAAQIRKDLALTLQRNQVAFAAGGVDMGSVSAKAAQSQVAQDAETELGNSNLNAYRAMLAKQQEARRLKAKASSLLTASIFSAVPGLFDSFAGVAARG